MIYMESISVLPDAQSGYRHEFSTTSLLSLSNSILTAFDKSKILFIVTLDFSKAFDTINHRLLLAKFKNYGLSDFALKFLHSYLSARTQSVLLNDLPSEPLNVIFGVPQSLNFGPNLFIVFGADLIRQMFFSCVRIYADDTFLEISCVLKDLFNTIDNINSDLDIIVNWARDNALLLNSSKSKFVIIDPTSRLSETDDLHLLIGGMRIDSSEKIKILGLEVNSEWNFETHVSSKCNKAYGILRALYPYRRNLSTKLKLQLSDMLILSLFNYSDLVYGPCLTLSTQSRVQRLQNSCLRFSYGLRKFDYLTAVMNDSKWLDMK